jgi:hypothetical protein
VTFAQYLGTGHPWETLFENWESEFLQMAVFVLLTTVLVQQGSPESRRPKAKELVDVDPRDFKDDPEAPGPVRRGGVLLQLYEHSLGLAFVGLFTLSWFGHASHAKQPTTKCVARQSAPCPASSGRVWAR